GLEQPRQPGSRRVRPTSGAGGSESLPRPRSGSRWPPEQRGGVSPPRSLSPTPHRPNPAALACPLLPMRPGASKGGLGGSILASVWTGLFFTLCFEVGFLFFVTAVIVPTL